MLVLSRKPGEEILIGENVKITIVRIGHNTVRVGPSRSESVKIIRTELIVDSPPPELEETAA